MRMEPKGPAPAALEVVGAFGGAPHRPPGDPAPAMGDWTVGEGALIPIVIPAAKPPPILPAFPLAVRDGSGSWNSLRI